MLKKLALITLLFPLALNAQQLTNKELAKQCIQVAKSLYLLETVQTMNYCGDKISEAAALTDISCKYIIEDRLSLVKSCLTHAGNELLIAELFGCNNRLGIKLAKENLEQIIRKL